MTTALLLIDLQNDYFQQGTMTLVGAEQAAANAALVLRQARAQGMPVVHIQHIAARPTATFFLPGTSGADIHPLVAPLSTEKVIVKHYPNSFRETELLAHLQGLGIESLIICGMMTHMCVDATTRAAKDYGFTCILIADACATKDLTIQSQTVAAQHVHASFLAALAYFYADVITTADYLAAR